MASCLVSLCDIIDNVDLYSVLITPAATKWMYKGSVVPERDGAAFVIHCQV